jgi:hypothetical protein
MQDAHNAEDVGAVSARVYEDALHLAKILQDGENVGPESYLVIGS